MKLMVVGGNNINNASLVEFVLSKYTDEMPISQVVTAGQYSYKGEAGTPPYYAHVWARLKGIPVKDTAEITNRVKHGNYRDIIGKIRVLNNFTPDMVIGIHDGTCSSTLHLLNIAAKRGLIVREFVRAI